MNTAGLLKIKGSNAAKFLQGQVTCDVEGIVHESCLGAHCNPQGRVLCLFRLFYFQNDYYLVMPRSMITLTLTDLGRYAVFFKIELTDASKTEDTELQQLASREWGYFDVRQGIPRIHPETRGKFLPHDLNLHQLGGISWEKGCYTGQEIIARMHYRGKLKNHLYQAKVQSPTQPFPGLELHGSHGAIIADCETENELHHLLIVANENEMPNPHFQINPEQHETWEWGIINK